MKLYRITDDEPEFVEAESYGEAIALWRKRLLDEWKESGHYREDDDGVEPESCELVSERPVIRSEGDK